MCKEIVQVVQGEIGHDTLPFTVAEGDAKTFSPDVSRLIVVEDDKKIELCAKRGPCPCQDPCRWGKQALDALQQFGWPEPGPLLPGSPSTGTLG